MPHSARPANYVRPYGATAPWNVAADGLATHPDSDSLVNRLWNDAPAARPGNFNLGFDDYTYPVYYASEATGVYTVDTASWANLDGDTMPWNPAWTPAPGSDAQVIVLDPDTGREWNLWQVSFDGDVIRASNGNLIPGNYLTKTDGFQPSRGVGIQYYAMLVQPEEIAAGDISHALSMPIRNTARDFVAPGTKSDGFTSGGIPMGTRFQLTATDAEIDAWVASLPSSLSAATKASARVIADALQEYGWFITDTAGGATWQFEARTTAGDLWTSLGLGPSSVEWMEYPRDLMDGLLAPDRIRAVVPSDEYGDTPPSPESSDTAAPTAALTSAADITAETTAVKNVVVRYADDVAVDISSLDGNDIEVSGPGGMRSASLSSIDVGSDGTPRTATYTLTAPGGAWEASDNGTYTVALQGNEVLDTSGNAAASRSLGTFSVAIAGAPPSSGPVDLVADAAMFDVVQDPLTAGQAFDVRFAVENNGTGTAGTFDVDFYLSTNNWISANDRFLGSRSIAGVAGNGTTGTLTETLDLPAADDGFWTGDRTYYVGMIIDDADVIDETSENNNYRTGQGNDRDSVFISILSPVVDNLDAGTALTLF